jgi:hypothetical protein
MDITISFETPVGTFDSYLLASAACERCDLDPVECIMVKKSPVSFAQPVWEMSRDGIHASRV